MNQDRNRDQDRPDRSPNIESPEGPSENSSTSERGQGSDRERNSMDSDTPRRSNSGGISNRPLDRERCEQEQMPDRGQSQSER